MIKILVVHDFLFLCTALAKSLEEEADFRVIGSATSAEEGLALAEHQEVDVILVSSRLPDQGAMKLTRALAERVPKTHILILGLAETREQVLRYIEAGASGYLPKDDSISDLQNLIRAVDLGKSFISPEIASALMERLSILAKNFAGIETQAYQLKSLTSRELEVLNLICRQMSNREIAESLHIALGTVKNHVHSILKKLNADSREQAAAYLAVQER